ncbi:MAG: hypothetical protein UX33_C0010G0012 [Candidatus Azambacteria bacterium GW2011_GWC1_46_13]|uniref:Uncharacterized protein n=1 Tax=Candidatus Azambacteria bacterium GW2011_GWC1_46_13 TaxID=1618619 RepID=A0A0G1RNS1_9BACT|nr:MAG: hypothetical protein UX33_C0010G0012 [Candidatus Azambacteria bacterium GW2011_GWC1_46_13]
MKKNLSILFSIIILSAFIGLGVRFAFAQLGWEEPANAPPLDNEIPFWIKNGNDLYHTTGGNVGIGSTSPTSKLEVVNSSGSADVYGIKTAALSSYGGYERVYGIYSTASAAPYSGGDFAVGVYGGASSTRGLPVGVYGSGGIRGRGVQGTGKVGVYGYAYGIAGGTGVFALGDTFGLEAAGDYAVYATGNTYGIFSDSGKNYFSGKVSIGTTSSASTLSLTGNVSGIGTTNPGAKLDVAGDINLRAGTKSTLPKGGARGNCGPYTLESNTKKIPYKISCGTTYRDGSYTAKTYNTAKPGCTLTCTGSAGGGYGSGKAEIDLNTCADALVPFSGLGDMVIVTSGNNTACRNSSNSVYWQEGIQLKVSY